MLNIAGTPLTVTVTSCRPRVAFDRMLNVAVIDVVLTWTTLVTVIAPVTLIVAPAKKLRARQSYRHRCPSSTARRTDRRKRGRSCTYRECTFVGARTARVL
jgi:hypothetical protein